MKQPKTKLIKPQLESQQNGKELSGELYQLLLMSVEARNTCGATRDIQSAYLRSNEDGSNSMPEYPVLPSNCSSCDCNKDNNESCDLCDESLDSICTVDEMKESMDSYSHFRGIASLLATTKAYDFTSLVEHAYAMVGNRPFSLKANRDITITDDQIKQIAIDMKDLIENYIEKMDIRVDEIPEAFNFDLVSDMIFGMEKQMLADVKEKNDKALNESEEVIERTFNRTNFMHEYIEVIKDTANYPIGIMWIDDTSLKKHRELSGNRVKISYKIQSSAERVNPAYCWFTPDYTFNNIGRAVFRLKRFSYGEIMRWSTMDVAGSDKLNENIEEFLDTYDEGGFIPHTMLFRNTQPLVDVDYDIIVARGRFSKKYVEDLDITIPDSMKHDKYIPCEVYFTGSHVLRIKIMEVFDDRLGVYTTVFRRNCESLFGYSVHDFTFPFAKLYENTLDEMDIAVGKSNGTITQVDTGVIQNPERYFSRDRDGNIVLDITQDNVIEFDSSEAYASPNFKGFPITISQIPSNLNNLIPMLNVIIQEMERITKIPTMLTDGSNISSALRTNSNFNAAFQASSKVVQALLREGETRVLNPSIRYLFDVEIMNDRVPDALMDLEPEILLSDTLTRERNDDMEATQNLMTIANFRDIVPPERFGALLNSVAKESFGYDDELVPNAGFLRQTKEPQKRQMM